MPLQIPPAVGSSGQAVETVIVDVVSSDQRHVMTIGSGASTAYAPVTSSGGISAHITNATTAVTVTNPSTAVTVTNPSTQVNTLSSGPVLVLSSGPYLVLSSGPITGTVTISNPTTAVTVTSGTFALSSAPLVIVATSGGTIPVTLSTVFSLSSVPTVTASATTITSGTISTLSSGAILLSSAGITQVLIAGTSGGFGLVTSQGSVQVITTGGSISVSTAVNLVGSAGAAVVTSSYGLEVSLLGVDTALRIRVGTSVGSISTSPGVLTYFNAYSTTIALAGNYVRLYNLTTNNATSSSNAGLAGAVGLFRIASSVSGGSFDATHSFVHGIRFDTACSYDIVLNATSTATQLGGWVTAQYTT